MPKYWIDVSDLDNPTDPMAEDAVIAASWVLYKLTGEKYPGYNTITECFSGNPSSVATEPALIRGKMYNISTATARGTARELYLGKSPVISVEQVTVNGQVMPTDDYELRSNSFLIKTNRTLWTWPSHQEVCVSYTWGARPPRAGVRAALRLANEFLMAYNGDEDCSLPAYVQDIERQGISFSMPDPSQYIKEGKTGIQNVDMFIQAANPTGARKRPLLLSPNRLIGETRNGI